MHDWVRVRLTRRHVFDLLFNLALIVLKRSA